MTTWFSREQYPAAVRVRDNYVCARCWSPLVLRVEGSGWALECSQNPKHEGFVSRAWVERRIEESARERREAERNLADILGLSRPSAEEAAKALGFDD